MKYAIMWGFCKSGHILLLDVSHNLHMYVRVYRANTTIFDGIKIGQVRMLIQVPILLFVHFQKVV